MTLKATIFVALPICLLTGIPALGQSDSSTADAQMLELRELVLNQTAKSQERLQDDIDAQLTGHREYLQDLNDRFYERFSFWLPIASAVLAVLFAVFLWLVGKTQKDAFEAAHLVAVSKATELAAQKINEVVIPAHVIAEAEKLSTEAIDQMAQIKAEMITELRNELAAARDQVVQDKHEVIMETLEEAIGQRFSEEVDILGRIRRVETALEVLRAAFLSLVSPLRDASGVTLIGEAMGPLLHSVPLVGGPLATFYRDVRQRQRERELREAIERVESSDASSSAAA